jgi:hypothetical protein
MTAQSEIGLVGLAVMGQVRRPSSKQLRPLAVMLMYIVATSESLHPATSVSLHPAELGFKHRGERLSNLCVQSLVRKDRGSRKSSKEDWCARDTHSRKVAVSLAPDFVLPIEYSPRLNFAQA